MQPLSISSPHAKTRLALLCTLGDLHAEPLCYNLSWLQALVAKLEPDLLCAELTQEAWESGQLSDAGLEVRSGLAPVSNLTNIVLVPVAPSMKRFSDYSSLPGWPRGLVRWLDRFLRWGQRRADRPEAIHGPVFGLFCHTLCWLIERAWTAEDRQAWKEQNKIIAENVLRYVQRDPGRRVLVAVQCQRLHRLLPLLKAHAEDLEIVNYQDL